MVTSNIERLRKIAEGFGEFVRHVAFVGGSVAELYADSPAATEIRMTHDVDCVVEIATYQALSDLELWLRKQGFLNDMTPGAPICRWVYKGEIVDIMPDEGFILGFTNEWYKPAFLHKIPVNLPDGLTIYIFPVLYYLATKIVAIQGRGGDDWRYSHDFEDLVYVLNNCQTITQRFDEEGNSELKVFLTQWASEVLRRANKNEEIECVLPYGDNDRVDYIITILTHFAKGGKE